VIAADFDAAEVREMVERIERREGDRRVRDYGEAWAGAERRQAERRAS
jgi:hypothetical protein